MTRWARKAWLVGLLAAGCSEPTAPQAQRVELTTDQAAYVSDDAASLTLTNHGPAAIGPGDRASTVLCQVRIDYLGEDGWAQYGLLKGSCADEGRPPLQPGGSVTRFFSVTQALFRDSGQYRFAVEVDVEGEAEPTPVVSDPITVTNPQGG